MRRTSILVSLLVFCPSLAFAQGVRSFIKVTPEGVVQIDERGAVGTGATKGTTTPAGGTTRRASNAGLRWVYPNPAGMPWITESVSSGNHGTFDWLAQDLNSRRVSLVATTDDQAPAVPIYESVAPNGTLHSVEVAAADKGPGCAMAWFDLINNLAELRSYDGFSPTPTTLAAPGQEVEMSEDGQLIAAGYRNASGNAAATIYDASLNAIITMNAANGNFAEHDLSADGSTLLIASVSEDFLYDVATGNLLLRDNSTVGNQAHRIDGNGDTWGRGGFDVGLWKRNGGNYARILTFDDPTFINSSAYTACDISKDGSTFVVAAVDAANWLDLRIYCWSVGSTSTTLLWTYRNVGTGILQDTPQAVGLSDDGKFIVVGTWGDENNTHDEVLIFDRDAGNVPIAGIDTPGSCFDVDISGNGQFVVAGTKSIHANINGNGGEAYSYDLGGEGFWRRGTMSLGRSFDLNVDGSPGDLVLMWGSLGLLGGPLTVSGFSGLYWTDPTLQILGITSLGTIPAPGSLTFPAVVPTDPAAVGVTVFLQVARLGASNTLENFLRLPITP